MLSEGRGVIPALDMQREENRMFREEHGLQPWNLMHRVSCRCLSSTDEALGMG